MTDTLATLFGIDADGAGQVASGIAETGGTARSLRLDQTREKSCVQVDGGFDVS